MQRAQPMMPMARQLAAQQAEVQQYTRDTYNYVSGQGGRSKGHGVAGLPHCSLLLMQLPACC